MKLIVSKNKTPSVKDNIFSTIMEAVSFSNTKDTIYIESGHYNEKLIIDKELQIIGNGIVIIYNDCDYMNHVITIKEPTLLRNLSIRSTNSNILYLFNCSDVIIDNCNIISQKQSSISIYDSSYFTIKNCYIQSSKICIFYNNLLNRFNHSGIIDNCNIISSDEHCIKLIQNSKLNIQNSTLKSPLKPIVLNEDTYIYLENITIFDSPPNYILYRKNSCPKFNLLKETKVVLK